MSHGELATVSIQLDDGAHEIRGVIVEVSRVPRSRRRRIVRRFDGCGYGVMRDGVMPIIAVSAESQVTHHAVHGVSWRGS